MYICGCDEGYYWWGKQQGCSTQVHNIGTICTGLSQCYNNSKEIECPEPGEDFYGQDANYATTDSCVPQNFSIDSSVEGQNIIIDETTGLMWQQNISEYTFTWDEAIAYCENLEYGGLSNWRLPTQLELLTIVDNGKLYPAVNTTIFLNIFSPSIMAIKSS